MAEYDTEVPKKRATPESYFDRVADPSETFAHEGSKYLYKDANPESPTLFRQEKDRLASVLGEGAIIEHFGSTAVENLGGKPVIDIYAAVTRENMVAASRALSEKAGYTLDVDGSNVDQARLFHTTIRPVNDQVVHYHTHLTYVDENGVPSPNFNQSLAFRDFLTEYPEHTARYDAAKRAASSVAMDLVAAGDEKEARRVYMQTKAPVVREIIEDMGKTGYLDQWIDKHYPKKGK